jgi:hypothetical protein
MTYAGRTDANPNIWEVLPTRLVSQPHKNHEREFLAACVLSLIHAAADADADADVDAAA